MWMRIKRILAIVMMAIMLVGCEKVDGEITAKAPEKKEEMIVETEASRQAAERRGGAWVWCVRKTSYERRPWKNRL